LILDATAGNRTMWKHKTSDSIIYIDLERKLKHKPTIFADNTNTPFLSSSFDTIFFDPPHDYGRDDSDILGMSRIQKKYAKKTEKRLHSYYGWKYVPTRVEMIKLLYNAQKEFHRILKNDGLLWLKWCELKFTIDRVLAIFHEWTELLRVPVTSTSHTMGQAQTYWICLTKEKREDTQTELG